ncbi:MAG: ribosome hibernation-promoting factor, HPF/YfiA family [Gemmatimonadota bacterium]
MQVNITARHCRVPEKVRVEAQERVQRLHRYEPRLGNVVVEFDTDHGDKKVETRIYLAGGHSIVAHGNGETFRTALDQSLGRLTRQLKRRRERVREHKSVKLAEVHAFASGRVAVSENTDD